jgi:hypothetical protein
MCSFIGLSFLPNHELFARSLLHLCSNAIEKHQHVSLRVRREGKETWPVRGRVYIKWYWTFIPVCVCV